MQTACKHRPLVRNIMQESHAHYRWSLVGLELKTIGTQNFWNSKLLELKTFGTQPFWNSTLLELKTFGTQHFWNSELLDWKSFGLNILLTSRLPSVVAPRQRCRPPPRFCVLYWWRSGVVLRSVMRGLALREALSPSNILLQKF